MIKHARVLLATAGVPAVAIAVPVALASTWSSRLPGVVAIHWTNGTPNNSASLDPFLTITLLVSAGLAMVVSALALTMRKGGLVYVTVDGPGPGAGLLNDLLRHQALTGPGHEI